MSIVCFVKYKSSTKKIAVGGAYGESDLRAALGTTSFQTLVKDKGTGEFVDIDEGTVFQDNDVINLTENPFYVDPLREDTSSTLPCSSQEATQTGADENNWSSLPQNGTRKLVYQPTELPICLQQQISQVKNGDVPEDLRKQIVHLIFSSLCTTTLYPTEHYVVAAKDLVRRYPQLRDASSTGFKTWHASIRYRAKNTRKRMSAGVHEVDAAKKKAQEQRERREILHSQTEVVDDLPEIVAIRNVQQTSSFGVGEDEASVNGLIAFMIKEMKKPFGDMIKVKDAMDRTFTFRRKWMVDEKPSIADVLSRYPALRKQEEIFNEFERLTGQCAVENVKNFITKKLGQLLVLLGKKPSTRAAIKEAESFAEQFTHEEKIRVLVSATFVLLPRLLREKTNELIRKLKPGEEHMYPVITHTGDDLQTSASLSVSAEGFMVRAGCTEDAVALLVSAFWTFNIVYNPRAASTLALLERMCGVVHTKLGLNSLKVLTALKAD